MSSDSNSSPRGPNGKEVGEHVPCNLPNPSINEDVGDRLSYDPLALLLPTATALDNMPGLFNRSTDPLFSPPRTQPQSQPSIITPIPSLSGSLPSTPPDTSSSDPASVTPPVTAAASYIAPASTNNHSTQASALLHTSVRAPTSVIPGSTEAQAQPVLQTPQASALLHTSARTPTVVIPRSATADGPPETISGDVQGHSVPGSSRVHAK